MEYDYLYKVILLGNSGSGKTTIMNSYLKDNAIPEPSSPTIGVDFRCKYNDMRDGKTIKLHIWDTAGQESFRSIIQGYYKGVAAAIIVFDVTCRNTFDNVGYWMNELQKYSLNNIRIPILLIGNKKDLKRRRIISYSEAAEFAERYRLIYRETNACVGDGVEEAMTTLIKSITSHYVDGNIPCPGVKKGIKLEDIYSEMQEEEACCDVAKNWNCCKIS